VWGQEHEASIEIASQVISQVTGQVTLESGRQSANQAACTEDARIRRSATRKTFRNCGQER
jgi:hypothetical protein